MSERSVLASASSRSRTFARAALPGVDRHGPLLARLGLIVGVLALVEYLVASGTVSVLFLAPPSQVAERFLALLPSRLVPLTAVTLLEAGVSLVLAAALGPAIGYLLWRYRAVGLAYEVLLGAIFASPTVLLYPIALVFLGRTSAAIVAMAVLVAVLPIAINTRASLAAVSPVLIRYGRTLRMSESQIFRHILLPAAAPGIFTGLRLGLSYMFKVILAMEFIVNIGGLGRLISESYDMLRTPDLYAAIAAVVGLSILFLKILERAERYVRYGR